MTHVTAGCVCGDFLDDLPGSLVECLDVLSAFQEAHTGPGHGGVRRGHRPPGESAYEAGEPGRGAGVTCKQCHQSVGRYHLSLREIKTRSYGDHDGDALLDAGVFCQPQCLADYVLSHCGADNPANQESPF